MYVPPILLRYVPHASFFSDQHLFHTHMGNTCRANSPGVAAVVASSSTNKKDNVGVQGSDYEMVVPCASAKDTSHVAPEMEDAGHAIHSLNVDESPAATMQSEVTRQQLDEGEGCGETAPPSDVVLPQTRRVFAILLPLTSPKVRGSTGEGDTATDASSFTSQVKDPSLLLCGEEYSPLSTVSRETLKITDCRNFEQQRQDVLQQLAV